MMNMKTVITENKNKIITALTIFYGIEPKQCNFVSNTGTKHPGNLRILHFIVMFYYPCLSQDSTVNVNQPCEPTK